MFKFPRYLGDGVFSSFDGYQVWLGLAPDVPLIALEPAVLQALDEYCEHLARAIREEVTEPSE